MKKSEAAEYFRQLAQNSGLDEASTATVLKALDNEQFAEGVTGSIMRQDDYNRNLDALRSKSQELDQWYHETAMPAYRTNLESIDKLHKYEQTYGDLDVAGPTNTQGNDMGQEEILKAVDERLRARDLAFISLQKDVSDITFDYYQRFGEKLDLNEIDELARKTGLPAKQAYKEYIAPKLEEKQKSDFQEKLKAAREEGYRDAVSKHSLPVDSSQRDSSPFFDRVEVKQPVTELEQDRAARSAFMDGWNNYSEGMKNANK
jgi:hypothetical protein